MTHRTPASRRFATIVAALGLAACTALAAPTLVGTASAAPAPSTPVPIATTTPQVVDLQGTENTRTFANYRTTDGKRLRGTVIRSDNLSKLSTADRRELQRRGVAAIVDLRTAIERSAQPDKPVPGAALKEFDVLGATPVTTLIDLPSAYRAFVTDPAARAAFRNTVLTVKNTVAAGDQVLFHCTAGKDRTGWASAVLLTIAGVDRATVERDFLASNTFRHTTSADPVNGVNISWLRTSFATADKVYGSFDNYIRRGLRLSDSDIDGVRRALTDQSPVAIANFTAPR